MGQVLTHPPLRGLEVRGQRFCVEVVCVYKIPEAKVTDFLDFHRAKKTGLGGIGVLKAILKGYLSLDLSHTKFLSSLSSASGLSFIIYTAIE